MKKTQSIVIMIIILLVSLTFTLVALKYINENIQNENAISSNDSDNDQTVISLLDDYDMYYSIEKTIDNYFFHTENSIEQFIAQEIYAYKSTFLIKNKHNEYYILFLDKNEGSFELQTITEEQYNSYINGTLNIPVKSDKIELKISNKFIQVVADQKDILKRYFNDYIEKAVYNVEDAYNLINEKYRQEKFKDLEEYKKYISEKTDYVEFLNDEYGKGIKEYRIIECEGYTQYIIIDTLGNYYAFNATSSFKYTIILDKYTLDMPAFLEKYDIAVGYQKAILNIQRVIDATNQNDYLYVYNKLDETFRNTNFGTVENFKNYIQEKYNSTDVVEYKKYEELNHIYVIDIQLNDAEGNFKTESEILIKLEEGTGFVMSFNIK